MHSSAFDVLKVMNVVTTDGETPMRYKCGKCDRSYKHRYHLNHHLKFECGLKPQFQCPHCNYKCKQKSNLKSHIIIKHHSHLFN